MGISRVQQQHGTSTSSNSVSASWSPATTGGNLLVAMVHSVNGSSVSITPPANWVLAENITYSPSVVLQGWVYYIKNAGSRSGSETFTFGASVNGATIFLIEYSGCDAANPLDQINATSGNSSSPSTSTSPTTTNANEACVGTVFQTGQQTFSSPTGSFTLVAQVQAGASVAAQGFLERIVSATGAYGSTVSDTSSNPWVGIITTFQQVVTFPFASVRDKKKRRPPRFRRKRPGPSWITNTNVWNESLWQWFKKRKRRAERSFVFRKSKKVKGHPQLFPPWFPHKIRPRRKPRWTKRRVYPFGSRNPVLPGPFNALWATALIQETNSATALVQESYSAKATLIYPP
jgi:hypothetical protein